MGRPSNAVREARQALQTRANKAIAKAEELKALAQATGAEVEDPPNPELAPPAETPESPAPSGDDMPAATPGGDYLHMLRGKGRIYPAKIVGTKKLQYPSMDREILSIDGREVAEEYGDGHYYLRIHDSRGRYETTITTDFQGYGEGRRAKELRVAGGGTTQPNVAPQPDPELKGLLNQQAAEIRELNEKVLGITQAHQQTVIQMMQENTRLLVEAMKERGNAAPAAQPADPIEQLAKYGQLLDSIRGTQPPPVTATERLGAQGNPLGQINDLMGWVRENKDILSPLLGIAPGAAESDWTDKLAKILTAATPMAEKVVNAIQSRQQLHRQPSAPPPALPGPTATDVQPGGPPQAEVPPNAAQVAPPAGNNGNGNGNGNGHGAGEVVVDDVMRQEAEAMAKVKDHWEYKQYVPQLLEWATAKADVQEVAEEILDSVTSILSPKAAYDILLDVITDPDMVVKLAAYESVATEHAEWLTQLAQAIIAIDRTENPENYAEYDKMIAALPRAEAVQVPSQSAAPAATPQPGADPAGPPVTVPPEGQQT